MDWIKLVWMKSEEWINRVTLMFEVNGVFSCIEKDFIADDDDRLYFVFTEID